MISQELHVMPNSDYYIYTASMTAKKLFFYPTHVGFFHYGPGYFLDRTNFDSFLIMLITEGSCDIYINGHQYTATKDSFVLLDCYSPHQYGSANSYSALWLHFDGPMARTYYEHLVQKFGNIIISPKLQTLRYHLERIYKVFKTNAPVHEADISSQITLLLNGLLNTDSSDSVRTPSISIREAVAYINEHFAEPVHLDSIAELASLSPFYFTRLFSKEIGMTPYQYLISTRISSAKYLLKSTTLSVKEIAFRSGFSSESSFCSAFKKYELCTPSTFRTNK